MNNWRKVLIKSSTKIIEAMKIIDEGAIQIALVIDEKNKLVGTVTDGDIRRGILNSIELSASVSQVMNKTPITIRDSESNSKVLSVFRSSKLKHIPVINEDMEVVGLKLVSDIIKESKKDNIIVLMAGGLGTRLQPLTNDCPKPLLKVGAKPILETIMESFIEYGFYKFVFSVNYKKELIKHHFGDGSHWGVEIQYLDEDKKLGTAGALSLLQINNNKPLIVMNGDILTKVNFEQLLDFHLENESVATMCVREYEHQIPYGVIKADSHSLQNIEEKPIEKYFVNAGIYILNKETLQHLPINEYFDMPNLFKILLKKKENICVFPIREYWLDVGQLKDYERANIEYQEVFT